VLEPAIPSRDRAILRDLAKRVADIAALPVQEQRRTLWKRHNSLQPVRPLIFPEGSWQELIPQSALRCEDGRARRYEWQLCNRIYYHEHFQDDTVIEGEWIRIPTPASTTRNALIAGPRSRAKKWAEPTSESDGVQ